MSAVTSSNHDASTSSLILAHRPTNRIVLILGSGKLAWSRARSALEAGASPLVVGLASGGLSTACEEIQQGVDSGAIQWRDASRYLLRRQSSEEDGWANFLDEIDEGNQRRLFAVCVTDTLHHGDDAQEETPSDPPSRATYAHEPPSTTRASMLARLCRSRRIPVNVADKPDLCDFSFPATHQFHASPPPISNDMTSVGSSALSSLQIAVTTNGRGCRLAGRIRREIVSALPRNVGDAVERVGEMRDMAKRSGRRRTSSQASKSRTISQKVSDKGYFESKDRSVDPNDEDDQSYDTTPLNSPVPQLGVRQSSDNLLAKATAAASVQQEVDAERTKRRMRWVAQISEYWPIEYLGAMDTNQMRDALKSFGEGSEAEEKQSLPSVTSLQQPGTPTHSNRTLSPEDKARGRSLTPIASQSNSSGTRHLPPRGRSQHSLSILPPPLPRSQKKGSIYLLGSGTGHPGLLTVMAHRLLTSPHTHLVLSDKLVPAPILRLIPQSIPLVIAKKFPGNAEGAQSELISLALKAALEEGKNVVRLKQGDPFVYGRGGEEVLAFRRAGIECTVVPGISSALAAPLMLGVPVTQRGAADSLVLCTGVGRGGKQVDLPGYQRGRSLIVLMGVARLKEVVRVLTTGYRCADRESPGRDGAPYPPHLPIALIERASSSDQRLIASTLTGIVAAVERCGEQRPPGMIMIGWAVMALEGQNGNVDVLEDVEDLEEEHDGSSDKREAAQDQRDIERVTRWLGDTGYVRREGLDDVYARMLRELTESTKDEPHVSSSPGADQTAQVTEERSSVVPSSVAQHPHFALENRVATGWAPARYHATSGAPEGGWTSEELGGQNGDQGSVNPSSLKAS